MKIRKCFVSNSSSSSFICDACGNIETGYDVSLEDIMYCECENEHYFCQSHLSDEGQRYYDKILEDRNTRTSYDDIIIPSKYCPVCQLDSLSDDYLFKFLMKETKLDQKDIEHIIRSRFTDFISFIKYVNNSHD